jgi:2-polyprenyl-6-methoxyphenol hydroxylase-like FAD-dependent oxidoreductase
MIETDIAIIGGGLAGSTAAAMLGRAGIATTLIDPHTVYPPDFRCEKLDGSQIAALRRTGLAEAVLSHGTMNRRIWMMRGGRVVDRKPREQCDILYDTMVNAMRAEIPQSVTRIVGKAAALAASDDRQTVTLSTGETISARLMILASGLNIGLRQELGLERHVLSRAHSISIGFDLAPVAGHSFPFEALTCFSGEAADRMAYLALFPIGDTMRANLFVYRDTSDPWLHTMRSEPEVAIRALVPELERVAGPFAVTSPVKIRPIDLVATSGHIQPGLVLVGDAFSTSCPAAGTGCNKVFTDVERLCNVHVPRWLETPGMGRDKIEAFYNDAEKRATDSFSYEKAFRLRALSTQRGLTWTARRQGRYFGHLAIGTLRRFRERAAAGQSQARAATGNTGADFTLK